MRPIWSGSISFGLVNIPVKLYSGSQNHNLDLDMLSKDDLCPIQFKRVCRNDGREVPYEDIVKGYQYQEGDYVVLTQEDFDKANVEKTNTIDIQEFVKDSEIDSVYYDKPYFLQPDKSGLKPYLLLREALKKSKKVGVATFVLRNKEHVVVVRPYGHIILINQLRFADEVRDAGEIDIKEPKKSVSDKEIQMALSLIEQSTAKFNLKKYKDTYVEDLKKIIEQKAKGQRPKAKGKKPQPTKVIDLMTLLKKSLKTQKGKAA
ncbi:MAG TPA: Ku protein [Ignavibacteriales bacterium]|nr:Ku protein [Ignavibacteriales bacterium]